MPKEYSRFAICIRKVLQKGSAIGTNYTKTKKPNIKRNPTNVLNNVNTNKIQLTYGIHLLRATLTREPVVSSNETLKLGKL